jgi:hypothetical protein
MFMPKIEDLTGLNFEGYQRVVPSPPPAFEVDKSLLPARDPKLRFSAPFLPGTFPSSDTLRGFHLGGVIPQYRIPVPAQASAQGAGGTMNTTIISTSSSSSSSTVPSTLGIIQSASFNIPALNPGDTYSGSLPMVGEGWLLYTLSATFLMRVRGYATPEAQTIDLTRPATQAPGFGTAQDIIFDVVMDTSPQWDFTPPIVGVNQVEGESQLLFVTIDNLSNSSVSGSVTIQYAPIAAFKDQI